MRSKTPILSGRRLTVIGVFFDSFVEVRLTEILFAGVLKGVAEATLGTAECGILISSSDESSSSKSLSFDC